MEQRHAVELLAFRYRSGEDLKRLGIRKGNVFKFVPILAFDQAEQEGQVIHHVGELGVGIGGVHCVDASANC